MKKRLKWIVVPALALGLGACQKKEEAKSASPGASVPEVVKPADSASPAKLPEVTALSAEERAAKLGFVKYLPQDTEVLLAFHNGSKTASRVKTSKLWKLIEEETGSGDAAAEGEGEVDPAEPAAPAAEEPAEFGPAALVGTEVTVAMGKSSGDQVANLMTFNTRSTYFQMRALAKALVSAAQTGDSSALGDATTAMTENIGKELLADPESGIGLLERSKFFPLYVAFRTTEAQREVAAQQLASATGFLAMLGEVVSPLEVERAGVKFAGYKISGKKVSEMLGADRAGLEESLGAETVDSLLAAIAKKDLVVLTGVIGDYAIMFVGATEEEFQLASDVKQSLAASDRLAFTDAYAGKELSILSYGDKESLTKIYDAVGGISAITDGFRDGIAGSEALGDTRDIEALLQIVGEREAALRKLASVDATGVIGYIEDGLKIETFGGYDSGALDWKTPSKLTHLGDSPDVVLFANATSDVVHHEKANAYYESLLETAYAITLKVSQVTKAEGDLAQFKQMAGVFDTQFRPDAVAIWDALSNDMASGLGHESAFVVDLKGSVPTIPGIPQAVVDQGKFPRATFIAPVVDRSKLSTSWDKINTTTTGLLAKVGGMTGQEIPMQKPISSEKNGYTTWFFSLPFFNDDFLPSLTVGDKWFAASTSKNQALELVDKAAAGGTSRKGMTIHLNFKALQAYSGQTLKVVDDNAVAIFGEGTSQLLEFQNNKETIRKSIETLEDLDSLDIHYRREGGVLRSSIHFKTR